MSIKNIPVFAKILLILSAFTALMLGSAVFSTGQMSAIGASYEEAIEHGGEALLMTVRTNRAATSAYASAAELIVSTSEQTNVEALARFKAARTQALGFLDSLRALGPAYAEASDRIRSNVIRVLDTECANTMRLGQGTTAEENARALTAFQAECQAKFLPLSVIIVAETDALRDRQSKANAELAAMTRQTVRMTFAIAIAGAALLMLAAFFAVRAWISRPLRGLTTVMERLANGDNTVTIPDAARRDEVGAMARTVVVFRDAALDKVRVEAESANHQRQAEEQRNSNELVKAEQASSLALVVQALANGLGRISEGDLTIRLDDRFAPEYERLRGDFNAAVQQMQTVLQSIVGSVGAIRSGTGEIAQAAEDLSRRTEQQAASLEQTAAALGQITTTVKRAAQGASQARTVVSRTRADAEASGLVVQNAVAAMSQIEKSSQQISQIIGVIDEIAFQTNLLALNAGVEAARAGDAGRGFAVVASEVRALAQRSAEAAREIKTLISASTQQVGTGVKLVDETGEALKRIVTQVGEVDAVVGEIAASAQEQATGLAEVNTAVNQMDQVTQQNAAMVEQSTAASHALATETESLQTLTSQFRLGDPAQTAPAEQPRAQPAPRGAIPMRAPARPPVRQLKNTSRRGEALALVPAAADDDWKEF